MGPQGPQGPPGTTAFGDDTGNALAGSNLPCVVGTVMLTASPTVGPGVPAKGQLLQINNHLSLFTLLGTTYGGNGTTHFALPDLRAAAPDQMSYMICVDGAFPNPI